jgi:hypothetical protein
MATLFNALTPQNQLEATILFYKQQIRVARRELKKSSKSAPDASSLPPPPLSFFHMLPASPTPADQLDCWEMVPSVVEDAQSQASSEHVVIDVAPSVGDDGVASNGDDAVSTASNTKTKKHGPHRNYRALAGILGDGTSLFIESVGDRWDGLYRLVDGKGVFTFNGTDYASPAAVSKAHASRITESHPKATKPGNGWNYICIAATNKTIAEVYDAANIV